MGPAMEEGLHVGRGEGVTGGLQGLGVGAGEKTIVETLKADAMPSEALFDPL